MKNVERQLAIKLRKQGKSYSEIRKKIKVSSSTLSLWLRNIKLTTKQKEEIKKKQSLGRKKGVKTIKKNKKKRIEITTKKARQEFNKFKSDPLFLSGLMLYWAEGSKPNNGGSVEFTNSDPKMINFIINWFKKFCGVLNSKFRISVHIHELHSRNDIEAYWSKITNIPESQFYKTQIKSTSLQHRKNKLYNGTCAIKIHDRSLFRIIKEWIVQFNEYYQI